MHACDETAGFAVRAGLTIPRREVWFEFSHASGPGGQNVNKVSSAVTLCFYPDSSEILSPAQKALVRTKLANRINAEGILKVTSDSLRSQSGNRFLAGQRFCLLLAEALRPVKKRTPTRPTRASRERRLADKRAVSHRKSERQDEGEY